MAQEIINIGTKANDGTGDTLRVAASKMNNNFTEIYNTFGANGQIGTGDIKFAGSTMYSNTNTTVTISTSGRNYSFGTNGSAILPTVKTANLVFSDGSFQTTFLLPTRFTTNSANSASYYADIYQDIIMCDTSTQHSNITVYLPDNPVNGKIYTIKNLNNSNNVYSVFVTTANVNARIENSTGTLTTQSILPANNSVAIWFFDSSNHSYRLMSSTNIT